MRLRQETSYIILSAGWGSRLFIKREVVYSTYIALDVILQGFLYAVMLQRCGNIKSDR